MAPASCGVKAEESRESSSHSPSIIAVSAMAAGPARAGIMPQSVNRLSRSERKAASLSLWMAAITGSVLIKLQKAIQVDYKEGIETKIGRASRSERVCKYG